METGGYHFKNASRPITLAFVQPRPAAAQQQGRLSLPPPSAVRLVGSSIDTDTDRYRQTEGGEELSVAQGADEAARATAELMWSCDPRARRCQLQYWPRTTYNIFIIKHNT